MNTRPFIGENTTFAKAFPKIKSLILEGTHRGDYSREWQLSVHYSGELPRVVPCVNPRCVQGGYDFGAYIFSFSGKGAVTHESTMYCNGHEGSPKGRVKGESCMNSLTYKLTIESTE